MLSLYQRIEEDGEDAIFKFRTAYFYLMYVILAVMAVGGLLRQYVLIYAGMGLMILYFFVIYVPFLDMNRKIRRAAKEMGVHISGSRWSFANPLTIRIDKRFI